MARERASERRTPCGIKRVSQLFVPKERRRADRPRPEAGTRTFLRCCATGGKSSSRADHEDCADRTACRTRSATRLWRHGTYRFLPHRGAGSAGARRHPVRQRRLRSPRRISSPARRRRCGSTPDAPIRCPIILCCSSRSGAGRRVRRAAFPHRPLPLPAAAADPDAGADDPAWPARPARSQPFYRPFDDAAAGLDLRCAAPADAAGQLARDRPPRPAARPAAPSTAGPRAISPSSAGSRRRSGPTGRSRSPRRPACR